MKKLVLFFRFSLFAFILFSSLFLIGCKSDTIYEPYIPDRLGNVSGYINSSDGPVKDAYLSLNNKTTFSDSTGFFEFKDCVKKNTVFTVLHPEFSGYSNSINVTDSPNLNIALTRIKYDYFPLNLGNQWTYRWVYGWHASGGYGGQSFGRLDLKIISVVGTYPNYTYQIEEIYYDSTNGNSSLKNINIHSNNSDSISISEVSYFFKIARIKRFYNITQSDTVHIFGGYADYNYSIKLKKNVGPIDCGYGMYGITFGYSTSYEILSYALN